MKELNTKDSVYGFTTSSKQKKVQSIFIYTDILDNSPQHFWLSFSDALSAWNVQFARTEKQKGFPFEADDKKIFIENFTDLLRSFPLLIVYHDFNQIINNSVRTFLTDLLEIPTECLNLLLLHNDEKRDSFSNVYYLSRLEEWDYYKQHSLNLSEEQLNTIRTYSDGWLAAVKKIAIHLPINLNSLLNNPEDTILYYFDLFYLNECTEQQQELIVQLSLMKEFPLELIRYLTIKNKDAMLENWLCNPFIRYNLNTAHFYFAEILYPHLKKKQILMSNRQKEHFYLSVANWYEECCNKIMAINYYRKAHAYNKMIPVIQQWTYPDSAEMANCYIEAINEIPANILDKHPLLHIIRCYMLNTLYRYEDTYKLMKTFCSQYFQKKGTSAEDSALLGEAYLLLGNTSIAMCLDTGESLSYYKQAAELLPQGSSLIRKKTSLFADIPVIRLPAPEPGFFKRYSDFMFQCEPYISRITGGCWNGCALLAAAEMNYFTKNFKEVEQNAYKAIDIAIKNNQSDIICSSFFLLMRFHLARGDYNRLMNSFELLNQYADIADFDTFFSMPDLAQSWLMLKLDKKNDVAGWIRHKSKYRSKMNPWNYGRDRVLRCQYLLLNQRFEEVIAYADASGKLMYERGLHILRIQILITKAISYHKLNEPVLSVITFEEVYRWTYKNNIIMPIVEYGKYIRPLVENCLKTDCIIPESWLKEIEKKANSYSTYQHNIQKKFKQNHLEETDILNCLTNTEQELLVLICQGIKIKTIAEMQGKSVSAIKGICRQIYTKLNVNSRVDAVRIATISEIQKRQLE